MHIVLFSHPAFMASQSMPRFAGMLKAAYISRGHQVQLWSPQAKVYKLVPHGRFKKWAGYIDQYILFPLWVRTKLAKQPACTLYVFCDQALGPWVPLVKHLPHVVHAHDLLALRSAMGEVPENHTGWTGKIYQRYIRYGFRQAKHFVSISNKTRDDLHRYGRTDPVISEVVYNGLNYPFTPLAEVEALRILVKAGIAVDSNGMLLHVSGAQWYKNLPGVIRMYAEYAKGTTSPLPLVCVSPDSGAETQQALREVSSPGLVQFVKSLSGEELVAAYSLARVFIFPSLEEGFGWPIIEAQACGCLVLTTDAPPMNEIGGPAASYIPRMQRIEDMHVWAVEAARRLSVLLAMDTEQHLLLVAQGLRHSAKFSADDAITGYLRVYERVLAEYETAGVAGGRSQQRQKLT